MSVYLKLVGVCRRCLICIGAINLIVTQHVEILYQTEIMFGNRQVELVHELLHKEWNFSTLSG